MDKKHITLFWNKVDKSSGCWNWTAALNEKGYGIFHDGLRTDKAHRIAWRLLIGEIKDNLCVLHKCDNPRCVNPDHLFLGTRADNNADMKSKGRHVPGGTYTSGNYVRGADHHEAKVNPDIVREIRSKYIPGVYGYMRLAKEYGLGASTVHKIIHRRTWDHVE